MASKIIILQTPKIDSSAKILADENFAKLLESYSADVLCVDEQLADTEDLKTLLASWNMPEFVLEQCQKYGLGVSHLQKIENEDISVLIPDKYLGVRIDFKFALREWRENQVTPVDINTNACSRRVLKWIQQNFEKNLSITPQVSEGATAVDASSCNNTPSVRLSPPSVRLSPPSVRLSSPELKGSTDVEDQLE